MSCGACSSEAYKEKAEKFLSKFYVNAESEYETMEYMDTEQVIKAIYSYDGNVYLCKLKGKSTGNEGYIAIAIGNKDNMYNIVYIE